jgi:starch phosphorylase
MDYKNFKIPYEINTEYSKSVAYFSMEFAIDQSLKTYSGGLGFLAGSHMRSVYNLKQNEIGIGILWKYGYYDQSRNKDLTLKAIWTEKLYSFLEDTGIQFQIEINAAKVWVKAWYLKPETFGTAPLFFLTTDLPENDYLAQTTCHYLYDSNPMTKVAQYILLGKGGAQLIEELGLDINVYHLNEAHGLPAAFHLLNKLQDPLKVKQKLVFTTHTPEEAGNEKHDFNMCYSMSYFSGVSESEIRQVSGMGEGELFNHSLCALRMARLANGVSKLHGEVSREMWGKHEGVATITSITNAQDFKYWANDNLYHTKDHKNGLVFDDVKRVLKYRGFQLVADQTGKIFNPKILTIVWARRFAAYKRPDLLLYDFERFNHLMTNERYPIQIIWAGKPYPHHFSAISTFNHLVDVSRRYKNMAVITGYELETSKILKRTADVWLNTPRVPREASGTSGMTAAMNGAINFSTDDGWIPEFSKPNENSFVIPKADYQNTPIFEQDRHDLTHLYDILENQILPMYYNDPNEWRKMVQTGMNDVQHQFDSDRMADEYYKIMYEEGS